MAVEQNRANRSTFKMEVIAQYEGRSSDSIVWGIIVSNVVRDEACDSGCR